MKTTVRTQLLRIIVEPNKVGGINLELQNNKGVLMFGAVLTQEEAGALIFGIEQAAMAADIAEQRAAA